MMLIRGGWVIDPGRFNGVADVLIDQGTIQAIGRDLSLPSGKKGQACEVVEAQGLLVLPGLIDLHVHLREPGYEHKETIATGTAAAAAGGFTSVCCMPNTSPINDNQAVTEFILDRAKRAGHSRVYPIGAITKGSEGKELAEIGDLQRAGCIAISDDGKPVMNSLIMRRAMEYATMFGLPVVDHCEDSNLSACGCLNEGEVSTQLGLPPMPGVSEEVMVARDILLVELTGARLHLAHLSTSGSVRLVREAKSRGLSITAEACPHHFTLTEEAVRGYNTNAKMNPPLRTWRDVQALKEGLRDGTIDVIATDHAPHAVQEKQQEFAEAPFGIVGLETALPLSLALVDEGVLSLEEAVAKLTVRPADVFGLAKGSLKVGSDADVVLVDRERGWEVDPSKFRSKSRNTPFAGWKVKGQVVTTILGGRIVHRLL
jgi:dihydroorotase